jgi:hypothetical protein
MSRFRTHWLALFGGVTLIALSMSSAFAGKPDGTNAGLQVSAYVHSLVGDVEATDADTETPDETTETTDTTDTTQVDVPVTSSDHGACVAAVAEDKEAVGGDNANHGGAVSEAARVTCQTDVAVDAPKVADPTEDAADTEVDSESEDATPESQAETENADSGSGHGESQDKGSDD